MPSRGLISSFTLPWPVAAAPSDDPDVIPFPTYRIERRPAVAGLIDEYRPAA